MKALFLNLLAVSCFYSHSMAGTDSEDSTGLAGDNLDLYAVLELFKTAESPEKFEELLNKEDSKVNNLDLNGDDEIDYIQVVDQVDSNFHALTLRVSMDENESQDVAVIEIEQKDKATAHLQIVGDEEIYGKDFIIEPYDDQSDREPSARPIIVLVNVWGWPAIKHIYAPGYKIWVSPWRWRHYPRWWKPWKPLAWRVYHPRVIIHHHHYHRVTVIRAPRAHRVYHNHRVHSANVHHHRATQSNNRNSSGNTVKKADKKTNTRPKKEAKVQSKNASRKKAAPRKK